MDFMKRVKVEMQLKRKGYVKIDEDKCILKPGNLVYVETETQPIHPYEKYPLDNPMTLDTFIHIYLIGKKEVKWK